MTGAKLMSVSRGNCNPPSNEKPTVMVTNCPAIAFTLRVSAKARLLNKRYPEHLEREMSTRASKTCVMIFPAECSCSTSGADSTSTSWPVWTGRIRRRTSTIQRTVLLLKNQTMICSIKHGMITLESLQTGRRSRKPGSLRPSITTRCTCSIKCLLLNAGRGQARRA